MSSHARELGVRLMSADMEELTPSLLYKIQTFTNFIIIKAHNENPDNLDVLTEIFKQLKTKIQWVSYSMKRNAVSESTFEAIFEIGQRLKDIAPYLKVVIPAIIAYQSLN